jgi:hypothetical protein
VPSIKIVERYLIDFRQERVDDEGLVVDEVEQDPDVWLETRS